MDQSTLETFHVKKSHYPFELLPKQRKWTRHVRTAFLAYSRRLVNKRRKRLMGKHFQKIRRGKTKLNLRQAKNNFFTTLYTVARKVIWTFSCGVICLRGPRKSTPFGAQQLGRFTSTEILKSKAQRAYLILKSSFTTHMRGCIKNLGKRPRFRALVDLIPRPHNGIKPPKLRRI